MNGSYLEVPGELNSKGLRICRGIPEDIDLLVFLDEKKGEKYIKKIIEEVINVSSNLRVNALLKGSNGFGIFIPTGLCVEDVNEIFEKMISSILAM